MDSEDVRQQGGVTATCLAAGPSIGRQRADDQRWYRGEVALLQFSANRFDRVAKEVQCGSVRKPSLRAALGSGAVGANRAGRYGRDALQRWSGCCDRQGGGDDSPLSIIIGFLSTAAA